MAEAMIPERTRQLMTKAVLLVLSEQEASVAIGLRNVKSDQVLNGGLQSSYFDKCYVDVFYDAFDKLAAKCWTEMKRVMREVNVAPFPDMEAELEGFLGGAFRDLISGINPKLEGQTKELASRKFRPNLRAHSNKIGKKLQLEIAIFCEALRAEQKEKEGNRMNQPIIYNVQGDNARVNVHSQDNSVNVTKSTGVFTDLRTTIGRDIADKDQKQKLLGAVGEMEKSAGQKATFLKKYSEFVELAANHMTILGPYLPALTKLLS